MDFYDEVFNLEISRGEKKKKEFRSSSGTNTLTSFSSFKQCFDDIKQTRFFVAT